MHRGCRSKELIESVQPLSVAQTVGFLQYWPGGWKKSSTVYHGGDPPQDRAYRETNDAGQCVRVVSRYVCSTVMSWF